MQHQIGGSGTIWDVTFYSRLALAGRRTDLGFPLTVLAVYTEKPFKRLICLKDPCHRAKAR